MRLRRLRLLRLLVRWGERCSRHRQATSLRSVARHLFCRRSVASSRGGMPGRGGSSLLLYSSRGLQAPGKAFQAVSVARRHAPWARIAAPPPPLAGRRRRGWLGCGRLDQRRRRLPTLRRAHVAPRQRIPGCGGGGAAVERPIDSALRPRCRQVLRLAGWRRRRCCRRRRRRRRCGLARRRCRLAPSGVRRERREAGRILADGSIAHHARRGQQPRLGLLVLFARGPGSLPHELGPPPLERHPVRVRAAEARRLVGRWRWLAEGQRRRGPSAVAEPVAGRHPRAS